MDLQKFSEIVSLKYKNTNYIVIQDGKEAGQTVHHLHAHIMNTANHQYIKNPIQISYRDKIEKTRNLFKI